MQGLVSVVVSPSAQQLYLFHNSSLIKTYTISTAKNGLGEQKNSYQTPRGLHMIRAKIGATAPINAIFKERRFNGEIYTPELNEQFPTRDWILTRILWLSGLEPGVNRLGNVDTMQRYIYIHGSPSERPTGTPTSKGCIRMRNEDIIEFFDLVPYGTQVLIERY
ncbi:MAG TPA: L,D-transpeptidase [Gammaproteobacteria bacterium]|nr:L,D-transpeptidase [Gammaproteobacteria bacterium]